MIVLNGLVGDTYYLNSQAQPYYGLFEHEGEFYYANDGGKIIKNVRKYVNKTNNVCFADGTPVEQKYYEFDADGKMIY